MTLEQIIAERVSAEVSKKLEELLPGIVDKIVENQNSGPTWLDVQEVANVTGYSVAHTRVLLNATLAEGGIPSAKIGARRLVRKDELNDWIERHREERWQK